MLLSEWEWRPPLISKRECPPHEKESCWSNASVLPPTLAHTSSITANTPVCRCWRQAELISAFISPIRNKRYIIFLPSSMHPSGIHRALLILPYTTLARKQPTPRGCCPCQPHLLNKVHDGVIGWNVDGRPVDALPQVVLLHLLQRDLRDDLGRKSFVKRAPDEAHSSCEL